MWTYHQSREAIFNKGQSKRIWNELYKSSTPRMLLFTSWMLEIPSEHDAEVSKNTFEEEHHQALNIRTE